MAKVYALIADGSEEVECLAVVDILRRSGIETVLVSAGETREKMCIRDRYVAFQILEYTLLDAPGAPLKQALIDAGIGKDVMGGYRCV